MHASRWLTAAVLAGTSLLATPADANYKIRTLTNKTSQVVSISFPVGAGGRGSTDFISGDMIVAIPGHGIVTFQDTGHTACGHPYWGVSIKYLTQQWGLFYDGEGAMDVTINADGTLAVAPVNGQVVNGPGPPQCR